MTAQLKIRIDLEVVKDILNLINECKEVSWGLPDEAFRHEAVRTMKDIKETLINAVKLSKEREPIKAWDYVRVPSEPQAFIPTLTEFKDDKGFDPEDDDDF